MKPLTILTVLLALCVAPLTSCSESQSASPTASQTLPAVSEDGEFAAPGISEAEARAFAVDWLAAATEGDTVTAGRMIDGRGIFERAVSSLELTTERKRAFASAGPEMIAQLVSSISAIKDAGGSYSLVRVLQRGEYQHVMLRLDLPDGAFNYHDIKLVRKGSRTLGEQIFVATTGEALSDTLRVALAPALAAQSSLGSRLSGRAKKELENLKQVGSMVRSVRLGDQDQALQIYSAMPRPLQLTKLVMLTRIQATSIGDEAAYLSALDDYAAQFPDDTSTALMLLDLAAMKEDEAMLMASFHAMDAWVGGDPLLNTLIANALISFGSKERALEVLNAAGDGDLGTMEAHDLALAVTLGAGDHAGTLRHMTILTETYDMDLGDLSTLEGWEPFSQSPEFKTWENRK